MPFTKDIKLGKRIKLLTISRPKKGKTVLAGSFPGPIYYFDWDGRMDPVKLMHPDRNDIEFDTYSAADFGRFKRKMIEFTRDCPYNTVVIDSLTFMCKGLMKYLIDLRGSSPAVDKGVIQMPEIAEYKGETQGLSQILDIAKALPCHFILNTHLIQYDQTNIKTNETITHKSIITEGKKVAEIVLAYFNEIWYLKTEKSINEMDGLRYKVYTVPIEDIPAGTSMPLPAEIDFTNRPFYPILVEVLKEKGIELAEEVVRNLDINIEGNAYEEETSGD